MLGLQWNRWNGTVNPFMFAGINVRVFGTYTSSREFKFALVTNFEKINKIIVILTRFSNHIYTFADVKNNFQRCWYLKKEYYSCQIMA